MHPAIHFNIYDLQRFKTFEEIHTYAQMLRRAVKVAAEYRVDNQHFWLDNFRGIPTLRLLIHENGIVVYTKDGYTVPTQSPNYDHFKVKVVEVLERVSQGFYRCSDCGKWKKRIKPFSFAGAVCEKCYDPTKHKGPDTRGD